jgi:U32 family peptidase
LHLSTQANTTNPLSVQFWAEAGVSRINLARELTLAELRTVRAATDLEIEVFVHGAMCVAYSGRCLLSATMTGRSANQGACTQPCRWKYAMVEETRPGEYFPIEEDHRGTYILNSRDLCMIDAMPHLLETGVDSLKIEGRMKSRYYVATVTRVYRAALDRYLAAPAAFRPDPSWREELEKVSHRPYDQGFLFGGRDPLIHQGDSKYRRSHEFVGVVLDMDESGFGLVEGRNRFFPGETLEILGPQMRQATFQAGELRAEDDSVLTAAQPNLRVIMALPEGTRRGDMLRREKKTT